MVVLGDLGVAYVGLMIRHSHVLSPELWRYFDWHAGSHSEVDHLLVDAFGMQVDLDFAATATDAVENGSPELVAAFGYAAFAVDTQIDTADRRAGAQKRCERVTAIRTVILGVQSLDGVVR